MKNLLIFLVLLFTTTLLSADDKCKEKWCYDEWGKPIQSKRLDPHTIRWPLHYTGEQLKDPIDGGQTQILVRYNNHYVTKTESLRAYRHGIGEDWFCKDGYTLPQPFECTDGATSEPTYDRNVCSLVGISKTVQRIDISEGCYKKLINWAVIDWCAYSGSEQGGKDNDALFLIKDLEKGTEYYGYSNYHGNLNRDGAYHFQQVIKVGDNTAPSILHQEAISYSAQVNCKATIKVGNTAVDNGDCPSQTFSWSAYIKDSYGYRKSLYPSKVNTDSAYVQIADLPTGEYQLVWTVKDGCGNGKAYTQDVIVEDNVAPTIICVGSLSIGVGSPSDPAQIWASDYAKTVLDNCTNTEDIILSFREDSVQQSLDLNCAEHYGETYMPIYAIDKNGNVGACEVKAQLNSKDPDCTRDVDVKGILTDPKGNPVSNATLMVKGQGDDSKTTISTDAEGRFSYQSELALNESLTLQYEGGTVDSKVSFIDILAINKHVNQISPFTEVYQSIAADINGDQDINKADLDLLVKHIMTLASNDTEASLGTVLMEKNTLATDSEIRLEENSLLELVVITVGDVYE